MDSLKVTLDMIEEGTAVLLVGMKRRIGSTSLSFFITIKSLSEKSVTHVEKLQ
jgi:hypothetical protein